MDNKPSPDTNTGIIIGIIIFILLTIFIIVVLVAWIFSRNSQIAPPADTETGNFLSSCLTEPCDNGLICDGSSFVCKFGPGFRCSNFSECADELICSGLCVTGATGNLNQLCPCNEGYICTPQSNFLTICKGGGGTKCETNIDCASGLCLNNKTCAFGAPNAFPCVTDSQCASKNCNGGFCQNPGVISGTQGSSCANFQCVGYTGAVCNSTVGNPLTCVCLNGVGEAGTCVPATQGILSICSNLQACSDDLICFNNSANVCGDGETGCICLFPYTDVNAQVVGSNCINGMSTRENSGECFNNGGLGCDIGGACVNSLCGGPPVLAVYQFNRRIGNPGINFIDSLSTSILVAANEPSDIIQPSKMFATSNGTIDTIYVVDFVNGFISTQYDPFNMTIISPWIQLIPPTSTNTVGNITTTRNLIDVGYNKTNFIVAFHEILVVNGTGGFTQENDTVYIGTNTNNLIPFNPQGTTGLIGTQYTFTGIPLSIDRIDISEGNDASEGGDILISTNGTIYIKENAQPYYNIGVIQGGPMNGQQMTGLTGPSSFYFDNTQNAQGTGPIICPEDGTASSSNRIRCPSYNNIAFVGRFNGFGGGEYDQVLQFSGNIAGAAEPIDRFEDINNVQYHVFDYSIYSPSPEGMPQSAVIMLTSAYLNNNFIGNTVVLSFGGNTTPIPYRIGITSRSAASANAFYVLSIASCTRI